MGEDGINWDEIIGSQPENGSAIGPDGTDVNGLTPQDWSEILAQAGEGLNPDGTENYGPDPSGGGGFDWSKILSFLGLGGGGGGGGIASLLPLLAAGLQIGGSVYDVNQSKKATEAALGRIDDTKNEVRDIFGAQSGALKPYQDVGAQGAQMLSALPQSALAGQFGGLAQNFQPLGTGRGIVGGPGRAPINNAGPGRLTLGTLLGR